MQKNIEGAADGLVANTAVERTKPTASPHKPSETDPERRGAVALSRLSIKARIFALVGLIVLALIGMGVHLAQSVSTQRHEGRQSEVQMMVESALTIVGEYEARVANGELSTDEAKAEALRVLSSVRYRQGDYIFVIDSDATMLMHPIKPETVGLSQIDHVDPTGKAFFREMVNLSASEGAGFVSYQWPRTADGPPVDKISFVGTFEPWDWIIGSGVYIDDVVADDNRSFLFEAAVVAVAALVLAGIASAIARSIANPIGRLTRRMTDLTAGDMETAVVGIESSDEIGAMARAVEVFRQNALRVQELDSQTASMAGDAEKRASAMRRLQDQLRFAIDSALDGNFASSMSNDFPFDDLNALAGSINSLMATLSRSLSETTEVLEAVANADLTRRVSGDAGGEFARLRDYTNEAADRLTEMVSELHQTSSSLRNATGEIMAGSEDLADRTTKQAAALEESSAALEQLVHSVSDNARRALSARDIARGVNDVVQSSGETIRAANRAMDDITQNSARISSIIGLIDDIAFQTNLLALNASVEAARAGEAGRGFAVVAIEVRRLAQSAAKASADVKGLVELSSASVAQGASLVADAAGGLGRIVERVQENAALVERIASANEEQANAITEISAAVRQMDEMTQHNAALVEETNAAIGQSEDQVAKIDGLIGAFRVSTSRSADRKRASA